VPKAASALAGALLIAAAGLAGTALSTGAASAAGPSAASPAAAHTPRQGGWTAPAGSSASPSASTSQPRLNSAARPNVAGPPLDTPFVVNSASDTVTGYPDTANGNAAPSYAVGGGTPPSPSAPATETFDASGDLWVGNANNSTIAEYTPAQLAQSGDPAAQVLLSNATSSPDGITAPTGMAFDSAGNLWVSNFDGNDQVAEFAKAELASTGNVTPTVILTSAALSNADGLAFDSTGNLWVAQDGNETVVEFTPAQLVASGAPVPPVVLSANAGSLQGPNAVAFDHAGNLWIANIDNSTVVEFTTGQLASSGSPAPAVVLSSSALEGPDGITFDHAGGLWVGNFDSSTVDGFTPAQLAASGSPAPAVVLSSSTLSQAEEAPVFDTSGDLWIANEGNSTLSEFAPTQLSASNSAAPTVTISASPGLQEPAFDSFDSFGNLWVADVGAGTVDAFTPAQLTAGATTPAIVLSIVNPAGPTAPATLAFDSHGDLWVADVDQSAVYELTPSQLAQSGPVTPAVIINGGSGATGFSDPGDIAFDGSGNLWVASFGGDSVVAYTPSQLAASGTPTPSVRLDSTGSGSSATINGPVGLAFDGAGNLWVANLGGGTVVQFAKSALAASGSPTPAVTLSATGSGSAASLDGPIGLAFDHTGDLWVTNGENDSVVRFAPSQLGASGSPVPAATLAGAATGLHAPEGIAFPPSTQRATETGYWEVASDGGIFSFGNHQFYGSTGAIKLNKPVVGMAPTPVNGPNGGKGYWLVATDGGIFSFGDAQFFGSTGSLVLNKPVVGMAATPDGKGYWLVASDGGIFAFGDAQFFGSTGSLTLNKPIVGMAATPDGKGYWLAASDGGIFAFGDAKFIGSVPGQLQPGQVLNKPVVGMASTPDGKGYWMDASDGGIFSFGDAQFFGSTGSIRLNQPMDGMATTNDGKGYWLVASDGGIFTFGNAVFEGSMGSIKLNKPVVGMST
jgi:sugar lactone lactonase YvrE